MAFNLQEKNDIRNVADGIIMIEKVITAANLVIMEIELGKNNPSHCRPGYGAIHVFPIVRYLW